MLNEQQIKIIQNQIVDVPDFPKKGILFKDCTPILLQPSVMDLTIQAMAEAVKDLDFDVIVAPEARGF